MLKPSAEMFDGNVRYSMGIDPGWKNLGYAVVELKRTGEIALVKSGTMNPSTLGHVGAIQYLLEDLGLPSPQLLTMERYVAYKGVLTAESENIVMTIGGLNYAFQAEPTVLQYPPSLVRAIEWKTELVKLLAKNKGFNNPSTSLDKKYSIAAAKECLDIKGEFKSDHEADAICMASLPLLRERYKR